MCVNTEKKPGRFRHLQMWNFPGYFHFLHHFYSLSLLKNNKHVLLFQKEVCVSRNCTYCYSGKGKERLCGRTFWVQGDEGDVVSDVLTPWLSTGGNGVAGLRPALPVLVVAVFLSRHLHHDRVLPTPRNRTSHFVASLCGAERGASHHGDLDGTVLLVRDQVQLFFQWFTSGLESLQLGFNAIQS